MTFLEKDTNNKLLSFNVKDFIFDKFILEMYI